MPSGFPDYQRITEWIGSPLETATAFAIGAGTHTIGPFPVNEWASVVVALKPTGGAITATVRQIVQGGPSSLVIDTVITAAAGAVVFETVPLIAGEVEVILQGSAGGETVDYAVSPANTTTRSIEVGSASMVYGKVNADGSTALGAGFTVNHTGLGLYVLTFNPTLGSIPVVVASATGGGGAAPVVPQVTLEATTGFSLSLFQATAGATNAPWSFVAIPT